MKAVKGNREYLIDENQKKGYQDAGFDIYDNSGNQIAYGRGKTVPFEDYAALKTENMILKEKAESLEEKLETLKEDNKKKKAAEKEKGE